MEEIFLKLLNMSITATWVALAVMILRFVLKKTPKSIFVAMWALVAIRLICPFSIESALSLIPNTQTIPENIAYYQVPTIDSGIAAINNVVNPIIANNFAPEPSNSANPLQIVTFIASVVWLLGLAIMLIYFISSYIRIRRKVREAMPVAENILVCDNVESPFILGMLSPKIYLPSDMDELDYDYVIAHEKSHIERKDHWWKPLGFLILSVYWVNPVLWIAYILLCRDIEIACDERVLRKMGCDIKKSYSNALINCSVSQKIVTSCPLAFGEVGVKERVKIVLNYKKPKFWIIVIGILACIGVAIAFLTNPEIDLSSSNPDLDKAVSQVILEYNEDKNHLGEVCTEGHIVYGVEEDETSATVYCQSEYAEFAFKNGYFVDVSGSVSCYALEFEKTAAGYSIVNIKPNGMGSDYVKSIEEMFPKSCVERALNPTEKDNQYLWEANKAQAEDYLKKIGRKAEVRNYSQIAQTGLDSVGISVDVSNKLFEYKLPYDTNIGWYERIENGTRYIYRTSYLSDSNVILYTKENYQTGDIIESIKIDGKTGNIIKTDDNLGTGKSFNAKVLEKKDNYILVEPLENESEFKSGSKIKVSLNSLKDSEIPDVYEDINVRIVYDGNILETYPLEISGVTGIYIMGDIYSYSNDTVTEEKTTISVAA